MIPKQYKHEKIVTIIVAILAVLGLFVAGYFYQLTYKGILQNIADSETVIVGFENINANLRNSLGTERYINSTFSGQINQIANTVGKLDQLSKTDKELLQKYSKVYFLNENYIPEDLTNIPSNYVYEKDKEIKFHTKAFPFLQDMINAATRSGINLEIISGFRSFSDQSSLKNAYTFTYGTGANKFSADQGYSEHQLGTTIDFTTPDLGSGYTDFEKAAAYDWLLSNAFKYGFVISYLKGNAYYQFEPWHWRFVGRSLANMLRQENKNFYDIPQRTIDAYLINIFD
ncbi:MAG: M15 family metallopeptidase [Patescibacteria group bacterium]